MLTKSRTMSVNSFKRLGKGSFATVFVCEGRGGVVLKQVHDPDDVGVLLREHDDLVILNKECSNASQLFKIPCAHGSYKDYYSFAQDVGTEDMSLPPNALYVMQRLWPISPAMATRIKDSFFPQPFRDQHLLLARLYMGKGCGREESRFLNTENFPLYTDRIEKLGLPAEAIAAGMGRMLASINFNAGRDGRDIEFVMCGNPENPMSRVPSYFCIDFNQMREHCGDASVIVKSMVINDPYYPRPWSPYWGAFSGAYLSTAEEAGALPLAQDVLHGVHSFWK